MNKKFRNIVLFLLLLVISTSNTFAQGDGEKVRAAKVAYIAERIQIPANKSTAFWEVYYQYEDEARMLRRKYRNLYNKQGGNDSDKFATANFIQNNPNFKNEYAELQTKYKPRFLKFISDSQFNNLIQAEQDFRKKLLNEFKNRK